MSSKHATTSMDADSAPLFSELLLLSDGRILVHNLTPVLANLLDGLGFQHDSTPAESQPIGNGRVRVQMAQMGCSRIARKRCVYAAAKQFRPAPDLRRLRTD